MAKRSALLTKRGWLAALAMAPFAALAAAPPSAPDGVPVPEPLSRYVDASLSGGPGKGGIPAIDTPRFWSVERADAYLDDDDIVFGVIVNGDVRAYPQRILVWHEIVNDTVGGEPIAVTYCPLTGTAIGFRRGETTFGVTGRLVNSNLIMYDRATGSWWPQVLGVAVAGPQAGEALKTIPVAWTTWGRWRARHPQTRVLSTETGWARNYRRDPYGDYTPIDGYYRPASAALFPLMHEGERLPPKRSVLVARTPSSVIAFSKARLRREGTLTVEIDGETLTAVYHPALDTGWVFHNPERRTLRPEALRLTGTGPTLTGQDATLEPVHSFEAMYFAYAAFYPEARLVE